ncbi:hypothetical protein [Streptomyces sp. NBRC 109706]|nr:hypothetical protein [Streptomyces sp. NBRC 109706]
MLEAHYSVGPDMVHGEIGGHVPDDQNLVAMTEESAVEALSRAPAAMSD